jgi:septum formation protein
MINPERPLLLASGSRYRAELLSRLCLPFAAEATQADETPRPGETVEALVARLARLKAGTLAARRPGHWILGSDQAASLDGRMLGKPGTRERAVEQLAAASGRSVSFHTAVALWDGACWHEAMDVTTVQFRPLSRSQIDRYLDREDALDCAGSFKCEGYGISLFEAIDSRDPTGLVGLPLIAVARLLREAGYDALP